MARLQVRVFGKLRLQFGETRVSVFPTRRVEELFGFLFLNQNSRHTREKLIDILWPEAALSNGRASLSTALWRLRTVFDQLGLPSNSYLTATRDWVAFEPGQILTSDHTDFERYLTEAERSQDPEQRIQALERAISLYRGHFCEGIYAEWCLLERERLERRYLWSMGQRMAGLIEGGEYGRAAEQGQAILGRDPLREEVHRALMLCYWRTGQRALGVRQFQLCARLLQRELQILPLPETISLYRRMVEDRLEELETNGRQPTPYQQRLKAAFDSFQSAADDLTALLDAVEEGPEAVPAQD